MKKILVCKENFQAMVLSSSSFFSFSLFPSAQAKVLFYLLFKARKSIKYDQCSARFLCMQRKE
jgi:hypothetical protein